MNPSHSPLISTRNAPGRTGDPNLHGVERLVSGLLGGWLVARGLRKGGVLGLLELAAGGMAIARGGSGQCNAKRALSPTPYESQLADEHHWGRARALSTSITVNRPRDEVYRYWRDFSNMPTFMEFIERVPGGQLGYALARGVSKFSCFKAEQNLRRFKQLMETGEISTGQMNREPADKHTGIAATGEAR